MKKCISCSSTSWCKYITEFNLTYPVNDLHAAKEWLKFDDMTPYLIRWLTSCNRESTANKIIYIEWELKSSDYGIIELGTRHALSQKELDIISDWVSGQNSDGLGETFEQMDFAEEEDINEYGEPTDYVLRSSFDWETNDYRFKLLR